MEGIPDHHERQLFTGRSSRWSRRLITSLNPHTKVRETGDSMRGDRDVRGSVASAPWEEYAHVTSPSGVREEVLDVDPPKRFGRRETSVPLVKSRGAQTPRDARAVKAATGIQERTRCGYTSRRMGSRYRSDASRVLVFGKSQDDLRKQGASLKESRSSSGEGHERREGEPVRSEAPSSINRCRAALVFQVKAWKVLRSIEGALGPSGGMLSPAGHNGTLSAQVELV